MNVESALKSQYHAALETLRLAIEKCPEDLWDNPADAPALFWRVAYHTLFYAHFYLQQDQNSFVPWANHHEEANFIAFVSKDQPRPPKSCPGYTRDQILDYWRLIDEMIDGGIDRLDLSAPQCGFPWYKMGTLEHQIVNIRHIQHHAAALAVRLRRGPGISVEWVAKG